VIDQVKKYLTAGYSVFPVRHDKRPYFSWEPYQHRKPTRDELNSWWGAKGKYAKSNVAIVTGKVSNLTVVDIDSKEGEKAIQQYVPLDIQTPLVMTPRGGYHIYFQHEAEIRNKTQFLKDCDIRSEGGYVVAPPSKNGSGNPYTWIRENALNCVRMPSSLYSFIISITTNTILYNKNTANGVPESPASMLNFSKGGRDDTLFHIANTLVKGGMPTVEVEELLTILATKACSPVFPPKEIPAKVKSALDRSDRKNLNITQEVRDFIAVTNNNFRVTDVQQAVTSGHRVTISNKAILMALSRLAKEGVIERLPAPSTYRVIEKVEHKNIKSVKSEKPIDILLPFGLDRYVNIYPGNLVIFAGVTNAGKSALILNMILQNMGNWNCWYFSTEMNAQTLKGRIEKLEADVDWDFEIVENWNQNPDGLRPNDLNFCDWIEAGEEPYRVIAKLDRIQQKLRKGIAVVAMQKNPKKEFGIGGYQTQSKAALYITVDKKDRHDPKQGQWARIVKAKGYDEINPEGFVCEFKIVQGINLIQTRYWGPETDDDKYSELIE